MLLVALVGLLFFGTPIEMLGQLIGDESNNGMRSVDMDGDGDLDVVSVSGLENEFRIFINTGSGYDIKVIEGGLTLNGVFSVADFNGDGAPDVVLVQVNNNNGRHRPVFYINMFHTSSTNSTNFASTPTASVTQYNNKRVSGVTYFRRHNRIGYINNPQERMVSFATADVANDGDMDLLYGHITTGTDDQRRAKWYRGYIDNGVYRVAEAEQIRIDLTNSPPGVGGNINGIKDVHHIRLADLNGDVYPDLVVYSTGDVYNPLPFNGIEIPAIHTYEYLPTIAQFRYLEEDIGAVELNEVNGTTVTLNTPNGFEVQDLDGDGDPEMVIATTNPNTGQTKLLIAGDNSNDTTFVDIEIPVSIGDFQDFELVDTDNDGVVDQVVVLTTTSGGTSTLNTYNFVPNNNNGSGQDALTTGSTVTLDETSYGIVVVDDGSGGSQVINDSDDTATLVNPPVPPIFTTVGLIGDESSNGMVNVDIDGDGDQDIFSASNKDNVLRWFRNEGNGSFTPNTIDTPLVLNGVITTGFFNNDDVIDVAVVEGPDSNDDYDVLIYLNMLPQASGSPSPNTGENFNTAFMDKFSANSNGYTTTNSFRKFIAASNVERVTSMQSADLQNDNDDDIVFSQYGGSSNAFDTKLLENISRNNFNGPSNLGLAGGSNGTRNVQVLRLVDYDNDGFLDLIWVSAQGNTRITTFTFDNGSTFATGYSNLLLDDIDDASDLIARDLDGDGDIELLIASTNPATGKTSIVIAGDNTNAGSDNDFDDIFDSFEIALTDIDNFSDFNISDIDGDGDLDLAILTTDVNTNTSLVTVYSFEDNLNNGSGSDAYTVTYSTTINESSFELVVIPDSDGNEDFFNDTENTDQISQNAGRFTLTIDYAQGWNLVSQPGNDVEGSDYFSIIESSSIPVFFKLVNGNIFDLASTKTEGTGYWVYYENDPAPITFKSRFNNRKRVDITEGWNLIGPGSRAVSVQEIYDEYPTVASGGLNIFAYNANTLSFNALSNTGTPDSLKPGQGYYFEAPSAKTNTDINGNKIRLTANSRLNESDDIEIPLFVRIGDRYEQKLILNHFRDISIPPSMSAKKSWLVDSLNQHLYSTTNYVSELYYQTDERADLSIRLDSVKQDGYLLIDNIFKLYPNYSINLPYTSLSKRVSIEWINESDNGDETIVNIEDDNFLTKSTKLLPNYPNPFNPTTTIPYSLSEPQEVVISIFNMSGHRIWNKSFGRQQAGDYRVVWNASNLATGVYLVEMQTSKNVRQLQRMTLMK